MQFSNFDRVMEPEIISKNGKSLKSHTNRENKIRLYMKRIFIVTCVMLLSYTAFGQQIKSKNAELDDIISLLGAADYEIFNYDISEMLNERYDIVVINKEFSAGKEIKSSNLVSYPNKRLLTDFPESSRQQFIDAGRVIDPITQAIELAEKISFGFYPSGNDSTKRIQVCVGGRTVITNSFQLRGLTIKDSDKMMFFYTTRPFQIKVFKDDEFIPLILISSSWYDERINMFRSCGEREIEPDMANEIYKNIPHHYIVGIKFVKKQ